MPVIIQITNDIINIGMDDGSILPVTRNQLNFLPSLGDEVRIFRSETQTIVTKVERTQYQQYQQPQYQEPPQYQDYRQAPKYQPNPVIINNTNTNVNQNIYHGYGRQKDKWVAFLLCFFLGCIGAHKFYEGKTGMGILYIFTCGLCCFGVLVDLISILCKPNPYYV